MYRWLRWAVVMFVLGLCGGWMACSNQASTRDAGTEQTENVGTLPDRSAQETPAESSSLPSGSLVVTTYNVRGLPASITKDDTNARLKAIGPRLNVFVIVGLQEVFTEQGYKNLIGGVKHPTQYRFNKALENRAYGAGLLQLSQYKAVLEKHEYFDLCNGTLDGASDCLASKGFHMVRYTLASGVEVDVYNSHFEAGHGEKDLAARAKNLVKLTNSMQQWSKGRALIFLGDTNLKKTRPSDATALETWMKTIGLVDSCEAVSCPIKGRIDRVFFRDGEKLKWKAKSWSIPKGFVDKKGTPLSDHEPIVVALDWSAVRP